MDSQTSGALPIEKIAQPEFNRAGADQNLDSFQKALEQAADNPSFRGLFIGILSCYVPPAIWDYALQRATEETAKEIKAVLV